jgi:hypothetical protein
VGWWFAAPDRENGKRRHAIQFEKQMDSIGGGIGQQGGCAAGWVEVAVRMAVEVFLFFFSRARQVGCGLPPRQRKIIHDLSHPRQAGM